jgi:hypothetical protein
MGFELRISEIWRVKLNEDQKPKIYGVFLKSEIYGIENGTENMSENRIVFCLIKMNREKLTISNPFWVWVGDGPGGSTMEMLQAVELNSIPPSQSIHLNVSRYECEGGMEFK